MYEVIGNRASRTFRVLWTLEELGQPYTHIPAGPRSDEVRAVSAAGKVPVLREGDMILTESVAIMTYLADRHGALTYPAGTPERARQDALTQQIQCDIDAVIWTAARHSFVLPEDKRVPEVKDSLRWEYERNLGLISAGFEGPFLTGEMMTIADILLTHCLRWAETAKFPEPDAAMAAYKARMEARDAFQRVLEMP